MRRRPASTTRPGGGRPVTWSAARAAPIVDAVRTPGRRLLDHPGHPLAAELDQAVVPWVRGHREPMASSRSWWDDGARRTSMSSTSPARAAWVDPREQVEWSVRLATGRLAGRRFGSREEAEAWADAAAGDEVVSFNPVCDCEM